MLVSSDVYDSDVASSPHVSKGISPSVITMVHFQYEQAHIGCIDFTLGQIGSHVLPHLAEVKAFYDVTQRPPPEPPPS